jgi:hypothetical protein
LKVYWEKVNLLIVRELAKSHEVIANIRSMGFKNLIMTDGKATWDIDLKN